MYTTYTDVDGKLHRREYRAGRRALSPDLVKVKVEFMTLPATRERAAAEAQKYGLSLSAYCDLAVSLFDISKFSS